MYETKFLLGLIAGSLVNVPGISKWFGEGYVTYSNEAKEKLLGVSRETLTTCGAVSAETAGEMARGAADAAGVDVAVAVTGIAGPDGGTAEKCHHPQPREYDRFSRGRQCDQRCGGISCG